jgi:hypothetical protein
LFTWYSAIPSCAIALSNSGSVSSFFSKIYTSFQILAASSHIHLLNAQYIEIIIIITKGFLHWYSNNYEESVWGIMRWYSSVFSAT